MERFFRNSMYPRCVYKAEKESLNSSLPKDAPADRRFTMLRQPVDTRWGSRTSCLQSVLKNRTCAENALLRLRRENFNSEDFRALAWVWSNAPWDEMAELLQVVLPLNVYVTSIESDHVTRSWALEEYITLRGALEEVKSSLPARLSRRIEEILANRDGFFFRFVDVPFIHYTTMYRSTDPGPVPATSVIPASVAVALVPRGCEKPSRSSVKQPGHSSWGLMKNLLTLPGSWSSSRWRAHMLQAVVGSGPTCSQPSFGNYFLPKHELCFCIQPSASQPASQPAGHPSPSQPASQPG